nr:MULTISPECIES: type II toxin-antitoxin system HicB family antitoxin [unclassified Glaciimonas]
MNNAMIYNGYTARIEFDPRDNIFVGRVLGITDSISFHGETVTELNANFHQAIAHYCADCKATGRPPKNQRPVNSCCACRQKCMLLLALPHKHPARV